MDLQAAADELYAAAPDGFVERRTALVAQARAAGDRPLAKDIGQLRRPTRSAWLVNLLPKGAADELTAWFEIGAQLRQAQRQRSGPDLRRLSRQRQLALGALTTRAAELAADLGQPASEAVRQEVSQTLQAALADPDVAATVRLGRVTQASEYGGFGGLETDTVSSVWPDQAPKSSPPATSDAEPARLDTAALAARRQREEAAQETAAVLEQAQSDVESAQQEAAAATARAAELADEVAALRERLGTAETAEHAAREQARTARQRWQDVAEELATAERAAAAAQQQLANG